MELELAIKKAENKLKYLSSDEKVMQLYSERERSLHERTNMISSAEARGQNNKAIEIARNLLDILYDETISLKTGLDVEAIKKLIKEN